jgi:hypothetical protein
MFGHNNLYLHLCKSHTLYTIFILKLIHPITCATKTFQQVIKKKRQYFGSLKQVLKMWQVNDIFIKPRVTYIYTYNCSTGAINCTLLILVCGIPWQWPSWTQHAWDWLTTSDSAHKYRYHPGTIIHMFSQTIHLLNFWDMLLHLHFISPQNAVHFIMLQFFVHKIFLFYIACAKI